MSKTPANLFDTVRKMLGRGFTRAEIEALDGVLDDMPQDCVTPVTLPPSPPLAPGGVPTRIGAAGIALIKRFEGCAKKRRDGRIEAYPDPGTGGDPWTIGWGATGVGIGPGTVWTQDACDARLEADLARYAAGVATAIGDAPTTQNQFDALVSFHYNTGAIHRATLTRKHVAGDHAGAAREFARWCYAGGRVMRGLQRRRDAEARLYRQ